MQNLLYEADRRIDVAWAEDARTESGPKPSTYPVRLIIMCEDRSGLLKEFTAIIAEDGTNIRSVDTKPAVDGVVNVDFVIETLDLRHLTRLTQNLRKVPGVRDVLRVTEDLNTLPSSESAASMLLRRCVAVRAINLFFMPAK